MVAKQELNVYTVMLIAAFLALLVGCIALAVEMGRYDSTTGARVSQLRPTGTGVSGTGFSDFQARA